MNQAPLIGLTLAKKLAYGIRFGNKNWIGISCFSSAYLGQKGSEEQQ